MLSSFLFLFIAKHLIYKNKKEEDNINSNVPFLKEEENKIGERYLRKIYYNLKPVH